MASLISNEKYSLYYQRIGLIYQRPEVRASLEVILSVFTITLLVLAAIRPTITNITSLQKKIADQEILSKKADNKITQLFGAQTQLSTYRNQLPLFDAAVPSNYSYYDMTARIEYLANKHGLTLESMSMPGTRLFGEGKATGDWATKLLDKDATNVIAANVLFSVAGNPQNIVNMIIEVENFDRTTFLKNIVFTKEPGKTAGTETLKATGQLNFYFYRPGT